MSEHTPGPWTLEMTTGGKTHVGRFGDGHVLTVAEVWECSTRAEFEANAKLMAAAPELLEALKAASDHLDYCGYGDSWERECAVEAGLKKQIAAAIEKAAKAPLSLERS